MSLSYTALISAIFTLTNVRVVKESGLVCVSYGKDNDDKVFVRKQIEAGVDAVIVDSVLAIRNELTSGGLQTILPSRNDITQDTNGSSVSNGANGTSGPREKEL
jgi:Glycerophosphoryl diester phosphodiesterase family